MDQDEVLDTIKDGEEDAYDLLKYADPNLIRRFKRLDSTLIKLLSDVREHFSDAQYYTASGGFHLMLGSSHGSGYNQPPQKELIALDGKAAISDGDF